MTEAKKWYFTMRWQHFTVVHTCTNRLDTPSSIPGQLTTGMKNIRSTEVPYLGFCAYKNPKAPWGIVSDWKAELTRVAHSPHHHQESEE
jgi:hypothetical protein